MPLGSHRCPRAHAWEPRTELPAASPGQPQHRRALTSMFPPTLASRGGSGLSRSLFSCRRDCLLPPTAKQPSVGQAPAARTDGQSSLCSLMGAGPGRAAESPHRPTLPSAGKGHCSCCSCGPVLPPRTCSGQRSSNQLPALPGNLLTCRHVGTGTRSAPVPPTQTFLLHPSARASHRAKSRGANALTHSDLLASLQSLRPRPRSRWSTRTGCQRAHPATLQSAREPG